MNVTKHPKKACFVTDDAPEWFEKQAIKYRTDWIKSQIYEYFGVSSLKEIEPAKFAAWAKQHGFALPSIFKG